MYFELLDFLKLLPFKLSAWVAFFCFPESPEKSFPTSFPNSTQTQP